MAIRVAAFREFLAQMPEEALVRPYEGEGGNWIQIVAPDDESLLAEWNEDADGPCIREPPPKPPSE